MRVRTSLFIADTAQHEVRELAALEKVTYSEMMRRLLRLGLQAYRKGQR